MILYSKEVNNTGGENEKAPPPTEMIRKLSKMLLVPNMTVFDENLFAFFFMSKQPDKALQTINTQK